MAQSSQATRRSSLTYILMLLALCGTLTVILSTSRGVGTSPDSTNYVGAARNLLDGHGLSRPPNADGNYAPLVRWPPLYPLLLALIGTSGADPLVAARWLNALLLGANIWLVGVVLARLRCSTWIVILGSFMMLGAVDMLQIHSMAWSEPLFLFFGLVGLLLLSEYADNPRRSLLLAAAVVIACAFLTRYVGLALIATGIAAILFLSREKRYAKKTVDSFLFAAGAGVPMLAWLVRNALVARSITGRTMAFHPITVRHIHSTLDSVSIWVLPQPLTFAVRVLLLAAGVLGAVCCYLWLRQRTNEQGAGLATHRSPKLPALLLTFIAFYVAQLCVAFSFLDKKLFLDFRTMSLVYPPALLLALRLADQMLRSTRRAHYIRSVCAVLYAAIVVGYSARCARWVTRTSRNGLGYAGTLWTQSEILEHVKALDPERPIYTNVPYAIYILTGRGSSRIPQRGGSSRELDRLRRRLEERDGVLVYFFNVKRPRFPTPEELEGKLPLEVLVKASDGIIYRVAGE